MKDLFVEYFVDTDEYQFYDFRDADINEPPVVFSVPAWMLDKAYNRATE